MLKKKCLSIAQYKFNKPPHDPYFKVDGSRKLKNKLKCVESLIFNKSIVIEFYERKHFSM